MIVVAVPVPCRFQAAARAVPECTSRQATGPALRDGWVSASKQTLPVLTLEGCVKTGVRSHLEVAVPHPEVCPAKCFREAENDNASEARFSSSPY